MCEQARARKRKGAGRRGGGEKEREKREKGGKGAGRGKENGGEQGREEEGEESREERRKGKRAGGEERWKAKSCFAVPARTEIAKQYTSKRDVLDAVCFNVEGGDNLGCKLAGNVPVVDADAATFIKNEHKIKLAVRRLGPGVGSKQKGREQHRQQQRQHEAAWRCGEEPIHLATL